MSGRFFLLRIFIPSAACLLLLAPGCCSGSTSDRGHSIPVTYNQTIIQNPRNGDEVCVTVNPNFHPCPPGYKFGRMVKRVDNMVCGPKGGENQAKLERRINNCEYIFAVNNDQNPICVTSPVACVPDPGQVSEVGEPFENPKCPGNASKPSVQGTFNEEPDYRDKIFFVLYSSATKFAPQTVRLNELYELLEGGLVKGAKTKIISHGFLGSSQDGPGPALLAAYKKQYQRTKEPINVILVDWSAISGYKEMQQMGTLKKLWKYTSPSKLYMPPRLYHYFVGLFTAKLVEFLVTCGETPMDQIHLIGHSLGAHAMAMGSRVFQARNLGNFSRITALDPAAPCMEDFKTVHCPEGNNKYPPVNPDDADFVDVIHTNGNLLGMKGGTGHADFYPNGGLCQPGCWNSLGCLPFETCSHGRSYEIMADSIVSLPSSYSAERCSSPAAAMAGRCDGRPTAVMGENCEMGTRGVFYVETNKKAPFLPKSNKPWYKFWG